MRLGDGDLLIALRTYLDSSGKCEKSYGYLTLAAVAANDSMWDEFETEWNGIVHGYTPRADYVHMREVVRQIDEFDSARGWNQEKAFGLVGKCLSYMAQLDKNRFRIFYCAVDLVAWRKLRAETYQMPDTVDMCNKFCSETVLHWYLVHYPGLIDPHQDTVSYFFDRGEPFKEPFEKKWNDEKDLAEATGERSVWQIIDEVASVEMKKVPGIQAADIIAWSVNREHASKPGEPGYYLAEIMRKVVPSFYVVWDEVKMRQYFKPLIHLP
jgi:Protein of unknown function (DUF3800)